LTVTDGYHSGRAEEISLSSSRCGHEYLRDEVVRRWSTGRNLAVFLSGSGYENGQGANGGVKLKINAANCVHCKTCDIADPYR